MKKNPILRCCLPPIFPHCIQVVLWLLFFSGPVEAMSREYPHLLLFPCGEDACSLTINVGADLKTAATSYATQSTATQEPDVDHGESNPQSALKEGLLNFSIRGTLSSDDAIGADAPEEFRAYDVAATFRLRWGWYSESGWGGGIRLMTGAGALTGGGETGLVVSLIPLLAFGSRDGRFTLDMGAGAALLSKHTFGTQDFGGYVQFALTAGVGIPLFKRLGAGYRFMHYSDASLYGEHTVGADMHMLEITYRF